MRVEFAKRAEKGRCYCEWQAILGKRRPITAGPMTIGRDIPHDLAQYVIESMTGCENGFWGSVARGATFRSMQKRRTKPGRAVIAANRQDLVGSEHLAGRYFGRWRARDASPVVAAMDVAFDQWKSLGPTDRLVFEWPSPSGVVRGSASEAGEKSSSFG
jgi:hypothetical protein